MKLLNAKDIMALLELHPPVNQTDSQYKNFAIWVWEIKSIELIKRTDIFPNFDIWPYQLKNKFNRPTI